MRIVELFWKEFPYNQETNNRDRRYIGHISALIQHIEIGTNHPSGNGGFGILLCLIQPQKKLYFQLHFKESIDVSTMSSVNMVSKAGEIELS